MFPSKVGEIKLSRPNSFLWQEEGVEDTLMFCALTSCNFNLIVARSSLRLKMLFENNEQSSQNVVKAYGQQSSSERYDQNVVSHRQNFTSTQMTHVILLTEVLVCPQLSSLSCMCRAARRSAVLHFISTAKRSCSTSPTLWKHTHSSSYRKNV